MDGALFIRNGRATAFPAPRRHITAFGLADVRPALEAARTEVAAGRWVAGFVAYEAAPAFDPALAAHEPDGRTPLVWLGVHDHPVETATPDALPARGPEDAQNRPAAWEALVAPETYHRAIRDIREKIAAGETYQVNYAYPMRAGFCGNPSEWFRILVEAQPAEFSALVRAGDLWVLSVSPELFFELDGDRITTRPMKGTARRGRWPSEDLAAREALAADPKTRAENLMITDLLRNDLGRIAVPGSVAVRDLFSITRLPSVWQMTSTVGGRTDSDVPEILAALFPCGSVTGAPKVRTSAIIRDLEPHPRGVYCGAVGWWGPGRRARFSVAIRTAVVDQRAGTATYSVGSGIVWDSDPAAELDECVAKAAVVLDPPRPSFELLETLLWEDGSFFLLDAHLDRLEATAGYFGFDLDRAAVARALASGPEIRAAAGPLRVRMTVSRSGAVSVTASPLPPPRPFRVALATHPVDERDVFLFHKTTHRALYDRALAGHAGVDDVILWNTRGELTESTIANLVLEIDGRRVTPPLASGLLGGVFREHLLRCGEIAEEVLPVTALKHATRGWLVNSVRQWIEIAPPLPRD